jgi:hypothetical protein
MGLGDWIAAAMSLAAIVIIFIPKVISFGAVMDHSGELDPAGNPLPNKWVVHQARRDKLFRLALTAIASGELIKAVLKMLGQD